VFFKFLVSNPCLDQSFTSLQVPQLVSASVNIKYFVSPQLISHPLNPLNLNIDRS
jgi:hypothetical protein